MGKHARKVLKIIGIVAIGVATAGVGLALAAPAALGGAAGLGAALGTGVFGSALTFGTLGQIGLAAYTIGSSPTPPSLGKTGANARGMATVDPDALGVYVFGETTLPRELLDELGGWRNR